MPPRPVLPKPTPEDANKLLAMLRNQKACKLPLDLTVNGATLEEVVAQVQAKLPQDGPQIEIRGARPIRLSFALKNSTVGEALSAAGAIADARLWVTSERLLLAPYTALTKEEANNGSSGGAWDALRPARGSDLQRVFSSLIVGEISTKMAANNGAITEGDKALPTAKTTFNMLTPKSREMLQELVDQMNEMSMGRTPFNAGNAAALTVFTLSPDTLVELNNPGASLISKGQQQEVLSVSQDNMRLSWSANEGMSSRMIGRTLPQSQGSAPPPPFIDPSANKS